MKNEYDELPPEFCDTCGKSDWEDNHLFFRGAGNIPNLCNECFEHDEDVLDALCKVFHVPGCAEIDFVSLIDGQLSSRQFVSLDWTVGKAQMEGTIEFSDFITALYKGDI